MPLHLAKRIFYELASEHITAITLAGVGDPLLHPQFTDIIEAAHNAGLPGLHVRTELLGDIDPDELLLPGAGVEVISVDLQADCAATYEKMMGIDAFATIIDRIGHLARNRTRLTLTDTTTGFALPWIVPRIQRCQTTHEDIDSFFDRWQYTLGTVAIDAIPPFDADADHPADPLLPAPKPRRVIEADLRRRMVIRCDGSVPISEMDLAAKSTAGTIGHDPLPAIWKSLLDARATLKNENPAIGQLQPVESLRTFDA